MPRAKVSRTGRSSNSKTRVSKSKKPKFQMKRWMVLGSIAIIAIVGIVIVRFSNASTVVKRTWTGADGEWSATAPASPRGRKTAPIHRTIDPSLPTANKTVIVTGIYDFDHELAIPQNIKISRRHLLSICVYIKIVQRLGSDVNIASSIKGSIQYGGKGPWTQRNFIPTAVIKNPVKEASIMSIDDGKPVEAGYRKVCWTDSTSTVAINNPKFVIHINPSSGLHKTSKFYIWKLETSIINFGD